MTFLGLKMTFFGHFSGFLACFKISFSILQHPSYKLDFLGYKPDFIDIGKNQPNGEKVQAYSHAPCNCISRFTLWSLNGDFWVSNKYSIKAYLKTVKSLVNVGYHLEEMLLSRFHRVKNRWVCRGIRMGNFVRINYAQRIIIIDPYHT